MILHENIRGNDSSEKIRRNGDTETEKQQHDSAEIIREKRVARTHTTQKLCEDEALGSDNRAAEFV